MGLTDSKMAAQVVAEACSDAEKAGKNDIEAVLADPKVLVLLHNLWSDLPDTAKRKIDPGITKRKSNTCSNNGRPKKVRKLKLSDSEFTLGPDFMVKVSDWDKDPLSFFNEGGSQLDLTRHPFDEMNTYMRNVTRRTGMDTVRLRLLKVMYYRLSGHVGWTQLRQKRTERMAQLTFNSDLSSWIDEGKRIDKLCRDIGCVEEVDRSDLYFHLGNLFYSLQDVADYCIKELPLNGDPRPEEVARLKKRSSLSKVEDRKRLETLAHKLTNIIWSAFQTAEPGFDSERHFQLSSHSVLSTQLECRTSEAAAFTRESPDCSTIDQGCTPTDENPQPMLQESQVDGSLLHDDARSMSRPMGQFETSWVANTAQSTQAILPHAGRRPQGNATTRPEEGNDERGRTQNEEYLSGSAEQTDSSLGEALENGSSLSRFDLHAIDALYDPRPNVHLIGPEYPSVSDVRHLDSLYDPRLNVQQIDSFYDPRLNVQPIDSLYDPRFNVQPIVDTPFAVEPDFVDSFGSSMQHATAVIDIQNDRPIVNRQSSRSAVDAEPAFQAPFFSSNFQSSPVPSSQVPECSA